MTNSAHKPRRSLKLATLGLRTATRYGQSKVADWWDGDNSKRFNKIGEDWFKTLGQLKGAPMKFGQFASQFADMLPEELAEHLRKLRSQAEPLPLADLMPVLEQAWSQDQLASITITQQALAAASIGQVHKGIYHSDGQTVDIVIKIRYPNIDSHFNKDMQSLRRLIRFGRILDIPKADLDAVFAEIKDRIQEEMDFAQERENLRALSQRNTDPAIVYPKLYAELCSENVLVTAYQPGDSLETAKQYPQAIRDQMGTTLIKHLIHQIFISGVLHADPNPGNFAFHPNGDVIIYDYGCVKHIPTALSQQLLTALFAYEHCDWAVLHDAFIAMDGIPKAQQAEAPPNDLYQLWHEITMQRFLTERPFDFGDSKLHDDAVAGIRKSLPYRKTFRPVADMVFVNRTISGFYWLLRTLNARIDLPSILAELREQTAPA